MTREGDALTILVSGSSAVLNLHQYLVLMRENTVLPVRLLFTVSAAQLTRPETYRWHAEQVLVSGVDLINHVEIVQSSRAIVTLPASANILASAALGLAYSPALSVILASPHPVLFFPNMNNVMWEQPVMQQRITELRGWGHVVVDPSYQKVYELGARRPVEGLALPTPTEVARITEKFVSLRRDERGG